MAYTRKAKSTSATARIAVNHTVRRKRSDTRSCLPEHVTGSPHGLNQTRLAALLELIAQRAHGDLEDVGIAGKIVAALLLADHVMGEKLARMAEKEGE